MKAQAFQKIKIASWPPPEWYVSFKMKIGTALVDKWNWIRFTKDRTLMMEIGERNPALFIAMCLNIM